MEGHLLPCAAHRLSNVPKGFQQLWQHGENGANFVSTEQVGRREACVQVIHLYDHVLSCSDNSISK